MANYFTKDRNTPGWVGSVSNGADYVSNKIQSGNEKLQQAETSFENFAAGIGIPQGFLGREDTARGLSSAVDMLLQTIDRTAQRSYIGHGFADYQRRLPNTKSVVTQTPEAIVLIKKRMFSSLAENYKSEVLAEDELHFIKASKKLFQNKCEQISNYEKLTKLNKILIDTGVMTSPIATLIFEILDQLEGTDFNNPGSAPLSGFLKSKETDYLKQNSIGIKKIRDALTLNGFNQTTTWINDTKFQSQAPLGFGTGVIELTLVTNLTTRVSVNMTETGSLTFTASDPYRLFMIDEFDIEKAMNQTSFNSFSVINIAADTLESDTEGMKQDLNNMRGARGASTLSYSVDVSSKIYNKVTIVLDRIGYQLTKNDGSGLDYDGLAAAAEGNWARKVPAAEVFTDDEKRLLDKIYKNLFKVMQMRMKDYTTYKNFNEKINYTRKLMRMNYLGRQIIQPMDTVTIFVDSQTIDDTLLTYGMNKSFADLTNPMTDINSVFGGNIPNFMGAAANTFGSTNFLGLLNKTVGQMKHMGDQGFNRDDAMKNMLVGKDFPYSLWTKLRSNFTSGNFGTCIFCGIVNTVSESYNDGSYSVSVNAKDNSGYFEQGWIQTQPGVDQFNGALFDPLTPFDFEFDASSGQLPDISNFKLLNENKQLLNSKNSNATMPDGKHAGQPATLKNFGDSDIDPNAAISQATEVFTSLANRVYTAPDGFVYRWKRGIGTAIINQSGTADGSMSNRLVQDNIALVAEQDPFGGQDLANCASILICGEPYNFNTFFQAAKSFGNVSLQSDFNPDSDYFQGFFKRIKKQNKVWGNFIPFKKITVDQKLFGRSVALQLMSCAQTTAITKAQDEKARLLSQLMQYEGASSTFDLSTYQVSLTNSFVPTITTYHSTVAMPIINEFWNLMPKFNCEHQSFQTH